MLDEIVSVLIPALLEYAVPAYTTPDSAESY